MTLYRRASVLTVVMAVVILMAEIDQSFAKQRSSGKLRYIPYIKKTSRPIRTGGCSAFGHSCFGGHGKRVDEDVLLLPGSDSDQQPKLVFPPPAARPVGEDDVTRQAGEYGVRSPSSLPSDGIVSLITSSHPSHYNLSPFLRQWLQSYRRSTGDI